MTTAESLHVLEALARLPKNWDSKGGLIIGVPAIVAARNILSDDMTDPPFKITPTRMGGLQLIWALPVINMQIDIHPDGRIELFHGSADGLGESVLVAVVP